MAMGAWGPTVPMRHARVFADSMGLKGALLGGDAVDVHGAVAALRGNVFVERVPGYALHVVRVFGDFMYAFPYMG